MRKFIILLIISIVLLNGCRGNYMQDTVILETNKGIIKIKLFTLQAPITTQNFIDLVNSDFYQGLTFHRYVEGFVIQGGDPKGDGTGGSKKTIPLEINENLRHDRVGKVAMARSQDPNSASSQFYITLNRLPELDGNYAVFGEVIEGVDIVLELRKGDIIIKTYLE